MGRITLVLGDRRILLFLTVGFVMAVFMAAMLKELGMLHVINSGYNWKQVPFLDKAGHFLAAGGMTFLSTLYFKYSYYRLGSFRIHSVVFWMLLIAVLIVLAIVALVKYIAK